MSLASGTKLGPYEIQSPLGAGGMGEVSRAGLKNDGRARLNGPKLCVWLSGGPVSNPPPATNFRAGSLFLRRECRRTKIFDCHASGRIGGCTALRPSQLGLSDGKIARPFSPEKSLSVSGSRRLQPQQRVSK